MSHFDELFKTAYGKLELANQQGGAYPMDEVQECLAYLVLDVFENKTQRERQLMMLLSGSTVSIGRNED